MKRRGIKTNIWNGSQELYTISSLFFFFLYPVGLLRFVILTQSLPLFLSLVIIATILVIFDSFQIHGVHDSARNTFKKERKEENK